MTISQQPPLGDRELPDAATFEDFWRRMRPPLFRVVAGRYRGDDPEEIVQETMIRSHEKWAELDHARNTWGWLVTVACNVAINRARARSRREEAEVEAASPALLQSVAQPEDIVCAGETQEMFYAAFDRLLPNERRVFAMHHFEEAPTAQIAELLGQTDNAIRQLLFRARRRFRDEYQRIADSGLGVFVPVAEWVRRWVRRAGAAPVSVAASTGACCLSLVLSIGGLGAFGGLHDLFSRDSSRAAPNDGTQVAIELAARSEAVRAATADAVDATTKRRAPVPAPSLAPPPTQSESPSTDVEVGPVKAHQKGKVVTGPSDHQVWVEDIPLIGDFGGGGSTERGPLDVVCLHVGCPVA